MGLRKRSSSRQTSRAGRDLRAAFAVGLFPGLLVVTLVFAPRYWVVLLFRGDFGRQS